jgi:hypothetical protein
MHFYRFSDPASNKGRTQCHTTFVCACAYMDLSDADHRTRFPIRVRKPIRPAIQPAHGDLLSTPELPVSQKRGTIPVPCDGGFAADLSLALVLARGTIFVRMFLGNPPRRLIEDCSLPF